MVAAGDGSELFEQVIRGPVDHSGWHPLMSVALMIAVTRTTDLCQKSSSRIRRPK